MRKKVRETRTARAARNEGLRCSTTTPAVDVIAALNFIAADSLVLYDSFLFETAEQMMSLTALRNSKMSFFEAVFVLLVSVLSSAAHPQW